MSAAAPTATENPALFEAPARWDRPKRRWHHIYPDVVAPGLDVPEFRVEHFLELAAARYGDRDAVVFYRTRWTYKELLARAQLVAGHLRRLGLEPGGRVLFVLPNCPEFVVLWFAVQWLGGEVVPGNPLYTSKEIGRLAKMSKAKIVVGLDVRLDPCVEMTQEAEVPHLVVVSLARHLPGHLSALYRLKNWMNGKPKVAAGTQVLSFDQLYKKNVEPIKEPVSKDVDKPAVLQPTGGTTGFPKLAVLTHRNLVANVCQGFTIYRRPFAYEVVLGVLPFFHVYGASVVLLGSVAGAATILLLPRFDPKQVFKICKRYRPTVGPMVPFMFIAMIEEMKRRRENLDCFEVCSSGASSLSDEVHAEFLAMTGSAITEGYGMSECSPIATTNFPHNIRVGTVGVPVPDTDVRLVDVETGTREVAIGEVGEITIKGPQVMLGYLDNPTETANTLRDGWLFTGDLATMDEDGFITIVDRKKDMIISGGLNIFPSEVEAVIMAYDGVAECAVVGEKNPKWGEKVVAYIVHKPGVTIIKEDFEAHCRASLAGYKMPREFRVVEALPVSFLGKLQRAELRRQADQAAPAAPTADTPTT